MRKTVNYKKFAKNAKNGIKIHNCENWLKTPKTRSEYNLAKNAKNKVKIHKCENWLKTPKTGSIKK